jgi:hypothetical protein
MNTRALIRLSLVVFAAGACTTTVGSTSAPVSTVTTVSPTASQSAPGPTDLPGASAPVDKTIQPVSISSPTAEAAGVLKACGLTTADRQALVAGMGLVPHARDVSRYIRAFGTEPELQSDKPAWVVQFKGRIDMGPGDWADNPACLVVGGQPPVWYEPEAYGSATASIVPDKVGAAPVAALPSLAP